MKEKGEKIGLEEFMRKYLELIMLGSMWKGEERVEN